MLGGKLPAFLTALGAVEVLLVSDTRVGAISFCAKLKLVSTGVTSSEIFGLMCNCSWRLRYSNPNNLKIKSTAFEFRFKTIQDALYNVYGKN